MGRWGGGGGGANSPSAKNVYLTVVIALVLLGTKNTGLNTRLGEGEMGKLTSFPSHSTPRSRSRMVIRQKNFDGSGIIASSPQWKQWACLKRRLGAVAG